MPYLVDTGVLLRLFERTDPESNTIRVVLRALNKTNALFTASQNISEFWNVSTRPATARGGLGKTIELTDRRLRFIESLGTVLPDSPSAYKKWRSLVVKYQVKGVQVHDAKLVGLMQCYSIRNIITLNERDFRRYHNITALSPTDTLQILESQT